ncbi:anaerobic sulfatase maturase [Desulforhopalus vacuolatus]|uniref:anaerobic sulfatase maturase n=1 Tax=Desulforhopalus vacuolatus TaxID=40414 RepID=UPI001962B733|nr:anaerobic sulfatase maturase [Desulforhopalus vacuolatus]MBM9518568.1 anaerobic sulfatase maturase [Desulforhopalus vacuolatus]
MPFFAVMAKPVGPLCNLSCSYCYYKEKVSLYPDVSTFVMPDTVLESFISQYFSLNGSNGADFSWQGGEPLLLGLDFFEKVIRLEKRYARGRRFSNTIQTNGTLINDNWCEFFTRNKILVGLSIDGPPDLHDLYRRDNQNNPTAHTVIAAAALLSRHGVEFNTLTTISNANAKRPLETYAFLKEISQGFIQFIPLVERIPGPEAQSLGLSLDIPPGGGGDYGIEVTPWSVSPEDFGTFYTTIFDEWVRHDVGTVFVQLFDVTLANHLGAPPVVCYYSPDCGQAGVLEHNGDMYACDHFVYPATKLGNIMTTDMETMLTGERQKAFGLAKSLALPTCCTTCDVLFACHGECPKNRFAWTPDGEPGLNYLCAGYKHFFRHSGEAMQRMAQLLRSRQPASLIMDGNHTS